MQGKLYIVGTPIGNLGDFSPRALKILNEADFIACEDTRVTRKLLTHFNIHKPLVSYYEHNSRESGRLIVARLLGGESAALVSDAGMPLISDPGAGLVAECAGNGIETEIIPGPSALTAALALSSIPSGRFCFEGFLSTSRKSRFEHLESLKEETRTMVFYEAPHKLLRFLSDVLMVLGDRTITICREMTKLHEETMHCSVSQAVAHFTLVPPRGEFVIVVQGVDSKEKPPLEEAAAIAESYVASGVSLSDAARRASAETGCSRREIYESLLKR